MGRPCTLMDADSLPASLTRRPIARMLFKASLLLILESLLLLLSQLTNFQDFSFELPCH